MVRVWLEQDIYSAIYVSNIAEDIARDIEQEQAEHLLFSDIQPSCNCFRNILEARERT